MTSRSMTRRRFFGRFGTATALCCCSPAFAAMAKGQGTNQIRPIDGSWISIWWDDARHHYWNERCRLFTAEQWRQAVKDIADIGMEYLVLLAIAKGGKAFYQTPLLPRLDTACSDPIEELLTGGDLYGVKFFLSSDWFAEWDHEALHDKQRIACRYQMMEEIATRYAHHRSFHGWYWPNEACLSPYFTDEFIRYVNGSSGEAHRLTPRAKTLTAPYGTKSAVCDDRFVAQLEALDVDIIAYQDEVGCLRMGASESEAAFERLKRAHIRVPQRALWADVETFSWEGSANKQTSPLIPAPFPRVLAQLKAVSGYADKTLIYQFQGLMNRTDSPAFAGHPQSVELYNDYLNWLRSSHPKHIRNRVLRKRA